MSVLLIVFSLILIQVFHCRIAVEKEDYIISSVKKHESILYSCFINNAETEVIIHDGKPKQFENNKNIESLHEGISLSISTFSCYQYNHLNFTFSLQLIDKLYHKDGGFKIYKNGKLQNQPNFKKNYRSFLGDVVVFEYIDKETSSPYNIKEGTVSLTFLGDISIFNKENEGDHVDLYKCQSFSATIWTQDMLYEIERIPTSSPSSSICETMTLSAIPLNRLDSFSQNSLNELMRNNIYYTQNRRQLLEYNGLINKFDCAQSPYDPKWENQWQHHHTVKIGLVVDKGFYEAFASSHELLDEYISIMFANTNGLFTPQLNIHIAIGDIFVAQNIPNYASSNHWWLDCNLQTNQYPLLKNWNKAKWDNNTRQCIDAGYTTDTLTNCPHIDKHAAFILLSTCHIGSGVAEIGKLCKATTDSAAAVNYKKNSGGNTWLIFVHELGHLFGAIHHFDDGNGGVMDYRAMQYDEIHQFRNYVDICWGIANSRNVGDDMKPICWEIYDYGSMTYKWVQIGQYSLCDPPCSDYQTKTELVKCIMSEENGNFSKIVDDANCGLELKPWGKFVECEESEKISCPISKCDNDKWEINEECDISLIDDTVEIENNCCQNNCTRKTNVDCLRLKKQIDAAFTDSNGKLYLFQGSQYAVYSNVGDAIIASPDAGYPKSIRDAFPISTWNEDFDAAFSTSDDIVYIFKDFSYIRIDLGAINIITGNAEIDASPISIVTNSDEFEFGYIPRAFGDCGRIDAAFIHSFDKATIVCGSIYYSWIVAAKGLPNVYRPFFNDYNINFGDVYSNYHKVDAASYIWKQDKIRFYAGDVYVDYVNGQQTGNENKLQAMGYWTDNTRGNRGNCAVQHNGECYDSSYLVVIQFEGEVYDHEHCDTHTNLGYDINGGVFEGSNAAVFTTNTQIALKIHSSMYSVITNWKMSIWLYPMSNGQQDLFHIIDNDDSHLVFILNTNSKCSNNTQLTITVTHKNVNDAELIVFEDTNCIIPLSLNKWSKLTFNAVPYMVSVTVNSKVQESNVIESTIDLTINLKSWYLGTNYIGKMDFFIFQETNGYIVAKEELPEIAACVFPFVDNMLEMVGWMTAFLALYTMGMWALYKYYGARVLLDQIARRFNMEQQQQAFNYDDNDNNNQEIQMLVMNEPQQEVEEVAAGMAIQAIEQVLSGQATPDFRSPINPNKLSRKVSNARANFLSPRRMLYQTDEQYDGNLLPSPAKKSPYRMVVSSAEQ